jgi:hypothetical protein
MIRQCTCFYTVCHPLVPHSHVLYRLFYTYRLFRSVRPQSACTYAPTHSRILTAHHQSTILVTR